MTHKTLRSLIASNDFEGYRSFKGDYGLRGELIEQAIYSNNGSGYVDYAHDQAFFEQNDVDVIDISTWTCTDTQVGLQVVRMAGQPSALIWQPYRKSDQEMVFLTEKARDDMRKAWEAARPDTELDSYIIDDASLDMPLAPPGGKQFDIAGHQGKMLISLSVYGFAQWLETLKDTGGIEGVTDAGILTHGLGAADAQIASHERLMRQVAECPPERRDLAGMEDFLKQADAVREMRDEIATRIEALTGDPVAPVEPKTVIEDEKVSADE